MRRLSLISAALVLVCALASCRVMGCFVHIGDEKNAQYQLRGQILRIDSGQGTVTIRHEDIKGFMPAMTMPFKVKDKGMLAGLSRGDLVNGVLVVSDTDAYLSSLEVTGHAEVPRAAGAGPAEDGDTRAVPALEPGENVPDVRLTDSKGEVLQFSSLRGSVVALTFIYTRCPMPQFCPLLNRQFAAVATRLRGNAPLGDSVRLLTISFDPEYDTRAVLAAQARAVGADGIRWRFATASRPELDAFAPRFGLTVMREADNTITHNMRTAIVDRQGRLVTIYHGSDWTVDQMVADLEKAATTR